MKNVAVFCKDREQMHNYIANVHGQVFQGCAGQITTRSGDINYWYMNGRMYAWYIKDVRWDAVVHLPDYKHQPALIEQVNLNLRPKPKKSKREVLIEELEQKLAELKREEGYE